MNKNFLTQTVDTSPFNKYLIVCVIVLLPCLIIQGIALVVPPLILFTLVSLMFILPFQLLLIALASFLNQKLNISYLYTLGLINTVILLLPKYIFAGTVAPLLKDADGLGGLGYMMIFGAGWLNWLGMVIGSWIVVFKYRHPASRK